MTFNELQNEVTHLGFETQIDDPAALAAAARRALGLIYAERPVTKTVRLANRAFAPLSYMGKLFFPGGEDITLSLPGRSYSFRVSGVGSYIIRDGTDEKKYDFNTELSVCKGLLNADGAVTFTGDCAFTVYGIVSFAERYGRVDDIPEDKQYREFDFSAIYPDFASFVSMPKDAQGRTVTRAVLRDGTLYLPREFDGEFTVTYRAHAPKVTSDLPDEDIEISGECELLLPLLTAAFLWLDDDAEKARYYMALYRDAMDNVRRYSHRIIDTEYAVSDGWA